MSIGVSVRKFARVSWGLLKVVPIGVSEMVIAQSQLGSLNLKLASANWGP